MGGAVRGLRGDRRRRAQLSHRQAPPPEVPLPLRGLCGDGTGAAEAGLGWALLGRLRHRGGRRQVCRSPAAGPSAGKKTLRFIVHWAGGTHTQFEMTKPQSPFGRQTSGKNAFGGRRGFRRLRTTTPAAVERKAHLHVGSRELFADEPRPFAELVLHEGSACKSDGLAGQTHMRRESQVAGPQGTALTTADS